MTAELELRGGACLMYREVRLLANGWVEAIDPESDADYYPLTNFERATGNVTIPDGGQR